MLAVIASLLLLVGPILTTSLKITPSSSWGIVKKVMNNNIPANSKKISAAFLLSFGLVFSPSIDHANAIDKQYKLPPIDRNDKNRCNLVSSSIGQANAARDKLFDLRECDMKGQSGAGKDMSGLLAENSDFSGVDFKEGQMSKAYARNNKFIKCDFTNAILDRVSFDGSDMTGSLFTNAVLSGTTFEGANLKDTDFSDSYLGPFDQRNLCLNPSLEGKNPVRIPCI